MIVNTYAGFRSVTHILFGWDQAEEKEVIFFEEHFVCERPPTSRSRGANRLV